MIDLSVIIVSYNAKDYLLNCLKSIDLNLPAGRQDCEIIVVDNASSDKSVDEIKKNFPHVKIIENKENLGFAKANNQGIRQAQGRYVLLLNPDTKILDNALLKMISWMDKNPKVSVSTCRLLNEDGSIQPTGGFFPTLPKLFAWQLFLDDILPLKSYHPKKQFYDKEKELDWVTGAFFLFRKEIIDKVGLFDEKFFMYAEELEYCYRIKKAGFKVFFTPRASIIHYGFKSGSYDKALIAEYESLKYFYKKHYPAYKAILARIILKFGALLRFGIISRSTYEKCFKVA